MSSPFAEFVFLASAGLAFVPVAIGYGRHTRWNLGIRRLWFWLTCAAVLNVVTLALSFSGIRTARMTQFAYPTFGLLGLLAFATLDGRRAVRRGVAAAAGLYLACWGWWAIQGEFASGFSTWSGPVLWLLLSAVAVALLLQRMQAELDEPLRDPAVLAALGVLIAYAPAVALEPVSMVIYRTHPNVVATLYTFRAVLDGLGSILFTLALLWTLRHPR